MSDAPKPVTFRQTVQDLADRHGISPVTAGAFAGFTVKGTTNAYPFTEIWRALYLDGEAK